MTYDPAQLHALGRKNKQLRADLDDLKPLLAEEIRAAAAGGVPQTEIVTATGYTREAIRQLCMSDEDREALNARRRKTA